MFAKTPFISFYILHKTDNGPVWPKHVAYCQEDIILK